MYKRQVLEKGYIPVISTVGCDSEGNPYNINADTAAARIAASLGAASLISMTDIRGILRDPADENTLIPAIQVSEAPQLIRCLLYTSIIWGKCESRNSR